MEQIDAGGDFPSRRAGPRVVLPRQGSAAAGAEQLADIVSSGGPHGFLPGQVSTASPGPVHVDMYLPDSAEWVELHNDTGRTYFWNIRSNLTVWQPLAGLQVVWVGEKDEDGDVWYWHRRTRASDILFLLCLLSEALRGLASPHPFLGATSGVEFWILLGGFSVIQNMRRSSVAFWLILYELWAGERLSLEKARPRYLRPGRPISVVPFGPGSDIWRSCLFVGAMRRFTGLVVLDLVGKEFDLTEPLFPSSPPSPLLPRVWKRLRHVVHSVVSFADCKRRRYDQQDEECVPVQLRTRFQGRAQAHVSRSARVESAGSWLHARCGVYIHLNT